MRVLEASAARHAGSIPARPTNAGLAIKSISSGVSSVGRARSFQVRGHRFETDTPLQGTPYITSEVSNENIRDT